MLGPRLLCALGSKTCIGTECEMSVRSTFRRVRIEDFVRASQTGAIFRKSGLGLDFSHFCQDAKIEIQGRFTSQLPATSH